MIPDAARSCIVKVKGPKKEGMGFLVDDKHIITCAHLLSPTGDSKEPVYERWEDTIHVTFLLTGAEVACTATITEWYAPSGIPCPEERDLAVLKLDSAKPEAAMPARIIGRERCDGKFAAYGLYKGKYGWAYGSIHDRLHTGCFQIQHSDNSIFIQGGYSGTPVWDEDQQGFVGMVVSAVKKDGIACVIPTDILAAAWSPLTTLITELPQTLLVCNLQEQRNKQFTGRGQFLTDLRAFFISAALTAHWLAIVGTGGVGKTQLAIEYIYRFHHDYRVIWWVRSEDPTVLAADYARLAFELYLPAKDLDNQTAVADAVRRWFETNDRWLLIFDNAPDLDAIYSYLPRTSQGNALITSQRRNWTNDVAILEVSVFDRRESIALLVKLTGEQDNATANTLAAELGDLPLAIVIAGRYCATRRLTLSEYLESFLKYQTELLDRGEPPTGYPTKAVVTFQITFEKVCSDCPAAAELFSLMAFFSPDNIPHSLLMHGVRRLPATISKKFLNELDFDDAIAVLNNYSLISVTRDAISVHRLNQMFMRDRLNRENKNCEWAEAAMTIISDAFDYIEDDPTTWAYCAWLLPHGLMASDFVESCCTTSTTTANFLDNAGLYLRMRAELAKAQSVLKRALDIKEASFGDSHPAVAITLDRLGLVLLDRGHFDSAKTQFERSLKIRQNYHGREHISVAWSLNNLGLALKELYHLESAQECYERAIVIKRANYGCDTVDVIETVGNLANVLKERGNIFDSKDLMQRVLEFYKTFYGHDHLYVGWAFNNLGLVLQKLYNLEGAKESYENSLKIKKAHYGADHVDVAATEVNLAIVFRYLGQCDRTQFLEYALRAKQLFEHALSIQVAAYGSSHPHVARTMSNLGRLRFELGDSEGAKKLLEQALKTNEEIFGKVHPIVTETCRDLAAVYEQLGDSEGAKKLLEQARKTNE